MPLATNKSQIWTYFSSSPDELACIEHAIQESTEPEAFQTMQAGAAQSEEEAIALLAEIASRNNALLIIRLHPRLDSDSRSKEVSSALDLMMKTCHSAKKNHPNSVHIVKPSDSVNSYILSILSDKVVGFRGTMPLEANLLGITPIVIAVKKGFSNYWIKDHADNAPTSAQQLERQTCCMKIAN